MEKLVEIKFFGRGGQGAVTAATILAKAAINEGKWAQALPIFGPERQGAPVMTFTRISNEPIIIRSEVYEPDVIVVLDSTLLKVVDVKAGFKREGIAIFNSEKNPSEIQKELKLREKVVTINAKKIALETLGRPFFNTAILGALVRVTKLVDINSVIAVAKEIFTGEVGTKNVKAIKRGYEEVKL